MKRRIQWALVLSLVLHAGVVGIWTQAPAREARKPTLPVAPLQFEVVEVPAQVESQPVEELPVEAKSKAKAKTPRPSVPAAPPAAAVAEAPIDHAPRGAILVPRESAVALPPAEAQASKGQIVHNTPAELPDPAEVLAYESEVVHRRVDGWAQKSLAQARVENGVVSYYFHDLRHRLEEATSKPPAFIDPFSLKTLPAHGKQAVKSWAAAAERFGKTGSAHTEKSGYKGLHGVAKSEAERGGEQAPVCSDDGGRRVPSRLRQRADG